MNSLERKTGKSRSIHTLPNYSPAGSYCFFSQCIFINSLEKSDLPNAINFELDVDKNHESFLKFAPLLNHEVKHWYDAHSTLWGLKLLRNIYSCRSDLFEAEKSGIGTQLPHFYKQMELRDSIEYIKFPEYYTTRYSTANTVRPWKYDYSAGTLFSKHGKQTDRPIFFTRFKNYKGDLIARVPFSLCALLEASAVAQELNTKVRIISSISDLVSKKVATNKLFDDSMSELYDENLVEYSVVAHKVANTFKIEDAIEAYNIAARTTRLILNLPNNVIDLFDPEKLLSKNLLLFFDSYRCAVKYRDRGSLFSLLIDSLYCKYQSTGIQVGNENLDELLEDLFLCHVGLRLKDVFSKSVDEVEKICSPVDFTLEKNHIDAYLDLGKNLHTKFGLIGNHFINLNNELIPEFILGDNTFFSQEGGSLEAFEKRYYELTGYYEHLKSFSKACIV